ncbi:hypothetical protein ACYSNL_02040 [Enterococcus cecorum]
MFEITKIIKEEAIRAEVRRLSELLTNMFVLGASDEEMERAINYSMDVIDACKSELRCDASKIDNGIEELYEIYGDEV